MSSSSVLTGYYRFTDIWFDWAGKLPNLEDATPLKAILGWCYHSINTAVQPHLSELEAHDALVHPDHPLHIDGVKGVQLYVGTLESGEARLLYSSKQVDYIRYWLHALGLTKEIIPLPYSDCLLTRGDLRSVSTVTYEDGGAVRGAIKGIDKNNKKLKGTNPTLTARRQTFERVRTLWAAKKGVWCALDFEAWERDHTVITEFGWSLVGWQNGEKVEEKGHIIVHESRTYTNGQYVPDHRYRYRFGSSETIKRVEFKAHVAKLLSDLERFGPVYLVFHDNNQDIKYLNNMGITLNNLMYTVPEDVPDSGLFVVDTSDMIGALLGEDTGNRRGLEKTCRVLQQETIFLHNAGNDAHYTLLVMIAMASGDQVDKQREERWPNQTVDNSIRVALQPAVDDSDYESDEEAVGPRIGYDPKTGQLWRTDEYTDEVKTS